MKPKVPNYNSLSSLLDRLAIENIKLSIFENSIEHDDLPDEEVESLKSKAVAQADMINVLKDDTVTLIEEAFISGDYKYISEGRTYK